MIDKKERLKELKQIEDVLHNKGFMYIAGVDEVGRGPLAGPVVAAAVVLPPEFDVLGIDDSKKVSEKKRIELNHIIREKAVAWGIGMASQEVIDDINILQATKLAMKYATKNLREMLNQKNLDDLQYVLFDAMSIEDIKLPQEAIIKGDSKALCIAAASIIAKVERDNIMIEYDKKYPGYSFASNKGYGTKAHYEGIEKLGITPIHRKSFLTKIL